MKENMSNGKGSHAGRGRGACKLALRNIILMHIAGGNGGSLRSENCRKQGTHKGIVDCHVMNRKVSHVEVKESMQTSYFFQFVMSQFIV